jgi:hypothetical protein
VVEWRYRPEPSIKDDSIVESISEALHDEYVQVRVLSVGERVT